MADRDIAELQESCYPHSARVSSPAVELLSLSNVSTPGLDGSIIDDSATGAKCDTKVLSACDSLIPKSICVKTNGGSFVDPKVKALSGTDIISTSSSVVGLLLIVAVSESNEALVAFRFIQVSNDGWLIFKC
ncbi:hypothetical protein OUZ56_003721 [Daphnia magna]|uniref:Uncharacterized protein n=1 Tax=Daphnia magna TaxID=35525 RepID=A0ABR0A9J8_9CRUS|nr:hypothetical protein OUZ56_003721 [Daphnia magna]